MEEQVDALDKESLSYKIPAHGQLVVSVLFNQFKWDAELVPVGKGIPSVEVQADYLRRELRLVAVFGFLDGKFCAAFEQPAPEEGAVSYLARLYTEHIYRTLVTQAPTKMEADASIAWLKSLYSLPDTRQQEN
jgi:hypothetical protein